MPLDVLTLLSGYMELDSYTCLLATCKMHWKYRNEQTLIKSIRITEGTKTSHCRNVKDIMLCDSGCFDACDFPKLRTLNVCGHDAFFDTRGLVALTQLHAEKCNQLIDLNGMSNIKQVTLFDCSMISELGPLAGVSYVKISSCQSVINVDALATCVDVHLQDIPIIDVSKLSSIKNSLTLMSCFRLMKGYNETLSVPFFIVKSCPLFFVGP